MSPLMLSSSLPLIPAKVMEKITRGGYVDFKELLADNVALVQRLQELGVPNGSQLLSSSQRLREVQDPLTWIHCFLLYTAARVTHQETRDLLTYGVLVINLARQHAGRGWLAYDNKFRLQKAAGSVAPWTEVNMPLMALTVLANTGHQASERACTICYSADHTKSECALKDLYGNKEPVQDLSQSSTKSRRNICHRFNRGICAAPQCRYDHACNLCFKSGHSALECPKNRGKATTPASLPAEKAK